MSRASTKGKSSKKKSGRLGHGTQKSGKYEAASPGRSPHGRKSTLKNDSAFSEAQMELQIRDLQRDKQALQAELDKLKGAQGKKSKSLKKEKEMRLQANKDRYWLQEKLSRMQMAIQARLKMLGIDFSNINDLGEALDAAFSAIQKLSAQLAQKEKENSEWESRYASLQKEHDHMAKRMGKLERSVEKNKETISNQKKGLAEKDRELKMMSRQTEQLGSGKEKTEKQVSDLKKKLKALQDKLDHQFDKFMSQKQNVDDELKETKEDLENMTRKCKDYEIENQNLKDMLAKYKALLDQANADKAKLNDELSHRRKEQEESDKRHRDALKALQDQFRKEQEERERLERELSDSKNKVDELEDTLAIQDEEIAAYKKDRDVHADANLQLQKKSTTKEAQLIDQLKSARAEKAKLVEMAKRLNEEKAQRDAQIKNLKQQLADAERRLKDYLERPRDDKSTQTELSGRWFEENALKLADLARITDENEHLHALNATLDGKVRGLTEENKVLVDEIDYLLKNGAKFRPDSSNHTGGVLALRCSPSRYMAASAATDKSVRLWKIDPTAEKSSKKVRPYASSQMEGQALDLAFTKDGTYLAAGTAYKNGPDGAILVWDVTKNEGDVEFMFRSRPTVRFGRVHCLCWSDDNRYIFSGDTTGSVWVWDTQYMLQIAEVNMHNDVTHSVHVSQGWLFSCALDQKISMFELDRLKKVRINPEKLHLWKPKRAKAKELMVNEKYPYWKVSATDDAKYVLAGGRKLWIWKWDGKELQKGPRATDSDLDHIQTVIVRRNMVAICRKGVNRLKIFNVLDGKEMNKASFKTPVSKVDFVYDVRSVVACVQKWDKAGAEPPTMKLVNLKK